MPRHRRKKKPENLNYEHIILPGPGFWTLPDLISCEGVERGRWTNILVVRASTYEHRHLAIPLLIPAVAALVAAPPTVVPFETLTPGRQINPPEIGKTLEVVQLDHFVCFRVITDDFCIPEFLTGKGQHVAVPFSFEAYRQLLAHLKAISTPTTQT